jgi:corrinoid protein of di/trimethylamine methyltransferase
MDDLLKDCARAVVEGSGERAEELARRALEAGLPALRAIEEGFAEGIREVGRLWEEGAYFLPELVVGADAMKRAVAVLEPALGDGGGARGLGHVVIGTIEGDIHDIGKTLVASMLAAHGFTVTDLGADVSATRFVEEAEARGAECVAVSSLLTTTMGGQRRVVEELERRSMRDRVKVLVGGAPVTDDWAREIGADGYAGDAVAAVTLARKVLGRDG